MRLAKDLHSLRGDAEHHVVRAALRAGSERFGFRLVHYTAVSNHLHLICEAEDARALARGMKGLCVRLARALNRLWGRTGALLADRFHARELRCPRDVRNTLVYVLGNARHHGIHFGARPDPCSSGATFDGWRELEGAPAPRPWLARARTWLLRVGWRIHGLISVRDGPIDAARRGHAPVDGVTRRVKARIEHGSASGPASKGRAGSDARVGGEARAPGSTPPRLGIPNRTPSG